MNGGETITQEAILKAVSDPTDVIREHLKEAHAILDLIYSGGVRGERGYIETLSEQTLTNAVNGCMRHIEEALKATEPSPA